MRGTSARIRGGFVDAWRGSRRLSDSAELEEEVGGFTVGNEVGKRDFDGGIEDVGASETSGSAGGDARHDGNDAADVVDVASGEGETFHERFEKICNHGRAIPRSFAGFADGFEEQECPQDTVVERSNLGGATIEIIEDTPLTSRWSILGSFVVEQRRELGQKDVEDAGFPREVDGAPRLTASKQAHDFFGDARACSEGQCFTTEDDGVVDVGGDGKAETTGELECAQDADGVFAEPCFRIADGVHDTSFDIFHASAPVEDLTCFEVVEESVHGEVAAHGVFTGRAKHVVVSNQEFGRVVRVVSVVLWVATKGGDFDDFAALEEDVDETKTSADDA